MSKYCGLDLYDEGLKNRNIIDNEEVYYVKK